MNIVCEMNELRNIEPGTLIGYGGHYYIKSSEVETDRENVVKSICCDVITGAIHCIDLCCRCSVYKDAHIKLG